MKNRLKHYCCITGAIAAMFGGVAASVLFMSSSTRAINNAVANKAMAYGIYECYKDGNIINKVSLADYDGLSSITDYGNNIILPTGYYDLPSVNCGWLLGGNPLNNFSGVAAVNGISIPEDNSNTSAVSAFMRGMGYTETKADGGKCASYTYKYESGDSTVTLKMCATVDSNGRITGDRVEVSGDTTAFEIEVEDKAVQLDCSQLPGYGGCGRHTFEPGVTDFDTFAGEILRDLEEHNSDAVCLAWWCPWKLVKDVKIESRGDVLAKFEFRDRSNAAKQAIKYLTGYNSLAATKLSESEKISLLQDYLKNYYKIDNYGCDLESSQQSIARGAGYTAISTNMFSGSGYQVCWIKPTENVGSSVAGYNSQGYFDGTPMSYEDIIAALGGTVEDLFEADKQRCNDAAEQQRRAAEQLLNQSTTSEEYRQKAQKTIDELDKIIRDHGEYWYEENGAIVCYSFTDLSGQVVTPPTETTTPPDGTGGNGGGEAESDECFGAAGSLGWILCPVLKTVSAGVDEIYKGYVQKQFLEIDSTKLKADSSSDVYNGWKIIRDMANIVFVIMFLVVLGSQLTGIGLTNYGIKKMLPRLITVAVLVNISFLLCQFAVDISNVLGYSMNAIFEQMSNTVNNMSESFTADGGATGVVMTWVGVLGIAIGAGTIGSWLIPFLLVLLSSAISVFFGAIILGARQAGIYILIVLAPAAIVCYSLPNAKTMFDRWFKMFTALLMVFPICGALMGGGNFASNILLSTGGGFFLTLVAMLLRVVPFFLIPGLIRSAFVAMGNIGAKIANVGNRIGRTTTGSIARSDFVKRRDADLARMQGGATALRGRALSKITGKPMSDKRKAKIARQYAKYNKLKSEEAAANPYAMSSKSREYEALKNAAHQNRIDSLAKNIALENTDIATDETALAERHAAALAALNEDQSDENLATVQAYQDMLISSDGGRTKMFDNYAQATIAGQDRGIELGAQHLLRNHVKDIKPNNRDFFSYLGEASRISNGGDVQKDSFREFTDEKGNTHYLSNHFANQGITSYDAASIAKMDEGSLDRLIQQAQNGALGEDQKRVLEQYTRQAMTSDTIHVQDKIAKKFNTLRDVMGYTRVQSQSQQRDSGTIDLHGNDGGNPGGSGNAGGPTIRTGNDDRSVSSGRNGQNSQSLNNRPGLRGTDDWRPNSDHGGIILPPGVR